jgi:ubiquitin carboxyl-terminal hydrolase 48
LLKDTLGSSFDAHAVFREPGEFVGLENLGATCYINAYLQVWFNNLFFRENILAIKFDKMELLDPENAELTPPKGQQLAEFKVKPSECLATNLQLVFTLMKESIRKSINPGFFIKAIGLDASEQQVKSFYN